MGDLVQLEVGRMVNKWKIEKKLGEGAFGAVYRCSHDGQDYALKTEGKEEKIQLLKMEVCVLMELTKANAGRHFCKIEDKGQCDNFIYVVMTFVGKSLADLRMQSPKRKFSMGSAISVGIQCLEALEDLHSIGYLHRDVKPANYTIGRAEMKELRKVYVLDFGMARKFAHDDGTIRKPRAVAGFRGTVKYAPVSCHAQRELCRGDDLESWLYMVIELTKGNLPWRNVQNIDEVGMFKKRMRRDGDHKELFGGCPQQYVQIMRLTDSLNFFGEPNYSKVYSLMREAMTATKAQEYPYDWELEVVVKKPEEKPKDEKPKEEKPKEKEAAPKEKEGVIKEKTEDNPKTKTQMA